MHSRSEALLIQQALNGGPHGPRSRVGDTPRGSRAPEVGSLRDRHSLPQNGFIPPQREILPGMDMLGISAPFPSSNGRPGFPQFPADPVFHPTGMFGGGMQRTGVSMRRNGGVFTSGPIDPMFSGRDMNGPSDHMMHGSREIPRTTAGIPRGSRRRNPGIGRGDVPQNQHGRHDMSSVPDMTHGRLQQVPMVPSNTARFDAMNPTDTSGQMRPGQGPNVVGPHIMQRETPFSSDTTNVLMGQGQGPNYFGAQTMQAEPAVSSDATNAHQTVTRGGVTTSIIISDETGVYYIFYPFPDRGGIRVNVTKDKFCLSDPHSAPRDMCVHFCYSDTQCDGNQKCCPGGCSLTCIEPSEPGTSPPSTNHVTSPANQSQDVSMRNDQVAACGQSCNDHYNCPGLWEYCLHSDSCGGKVCRNFV